MRPAPCAEAIKKDHNVRSRKPTRMPTHRGCRARTKSIDPEANERQSRHPAKGVVADAGMHERDERDNQSRPRAHGPQRSVAGHSKLPNAAALAAQGDRKEPAHPGINAMKGAKAEQRQPRPGTAHG